MKSISAFSFGALFAITITCAVFLLPQTTLAQTAATTGSTPSATASDILSGDGGAIATFLGCFTAGAVAKSWLGGLITTACGLSLPKTIAATIASAGSFVLISLGKLFDLVITTFVFDFNENFRLINEYLDVLWRTVRDLMNIAIVGIFTFIAIAIILGVESYGQKRFIANVLIAACLINFSYLFTRIGISVSNQLAISTYRFLIDQSGVVNNSGGYSYYAAFQNAIGFGETSHYERLKGIYDSEYNNAAPGVATKAAGYGKGYISVLFAGILVFLAYIGASIMFVYGSILLVANFIMWAILLVSSPFAFWTFTVPSLRESKFGWNNWWSSIVRTALLVPIMFFLLGITIKITSGFHAKSNGDFYGLIMVQAVAIVMLYISFRFSSSFAGSISNFNFAALVPTGLFAAGSAIAGAGIRNTVGLYATGKEEKYKSAAKAYARNEQFLRAGLYSQFANTAGAVAKKDFNASRTAVGSDIMKLGSLSEKLTEAMKGKEQGGFKGREEALVKAIGKEIHDNALSKKQIEGIHDDIRKKYGGEVYGSNGKSWNDLNDDHQKTIREQRKAEGERDDIIKATGASKKEIDRIKDMVEKNLSKATLSTEGQRIYDAQSAVKAVRQRVSDIDAIRSGPAFDKNNNEIKENGVQVSLDLALQVKGNPELRKKLNNDNARIHPRKGKAFKLELDDLAEESHHDAHHGAVARRKYTTLISAWRRARVDTKLNEANRKPSASEHH